MGGSHFVSTRSWIETPMSNRPTCTGRSLIAELYALVSLIGLAGYLVAAMAF